MAFEKSIIVSLLDYYFSLLFWSPSDTIQQYETVRELVPLECIYPGDSNWMHVAQRRMIFGVVDDGGHTTVRELSNFFLGDGC